MMTVFLQLFHNSALRLLFRYGLVGVFASFVHWMVSCLIFEYQNASYLIAHSIGFFSGLVPAYLGHYFFSFKDNQQHKLRFPKFFFVSFLAFIIHQIGAFLLVDKAQLGYSSFTLPLLVVLVPVFTFLLNRFWVFSEKG